MNKAEQIQQIVEELLTKLSFSGTVQVVESEQSYQIQIRLESDQSLLIGQAGAHLAALQHLVRLMLRKQIAQEESLKEVYLDVNGYWEEKEKKLADEARARAAEVLATGEEQILPFMEAHDRRVVHAALVSVEGVQTESFGTGRDRRMRIFTVNKEAGVESL
jgi:spoIIIJ-associated protein